MQTENNIFYWGLWAICFIVSKVAGVATAIAVFIPSNIELPQHEINYLPQFHELIPAMILAACCAFVSLLVKEVYQTIKRKIFPPSK